MKTRYTPPNPSSTSLSISSLTSFLLHLSSATAATDDHHIFTYYESTDYINHFNSIRSPLTFQETLKLQVPYNTLHGYLQIMGSNKGVICLFDTNFHSTLGAILLWNPSIQKLKFVYDHQNVHEKFSHFALGFGFVSRTFEFKVVEIAYEHLHDSNIDNIVMVYSLSTNSWKKKKDMSAPCYLHEGWSSSVLVNGYVNWLALKKAVSGDTNVIMAFDLDKERFRVFELPEITGPNGDVISICSYGEESLSLALCAFGEKWEVWVMADYGLTDSWKKVFVVSQPILKVPLLLLKNDDEVLIVTKNGRLVLFDRINNMQHDLETQGDESKVRLLKSFPYAEERLHLFEADIYKPEEFQKPIQGCVFVFHYNNTVDATVNAVKKIIDACIHSGTVKRLIYTASVVAASPLKDDENEQEILKIGDEKGNELEVVTLGCGLVGGGGCLPYPANSVLVFISQITNNATNYQALRYLKELGREIKWGLKKLEDKGFAYKYSTKMILDDCLECAKRSGLISSTNNYS
ncbi:hypothetical protein L1987_28651 [Smallanthus sonchifolius]|uniref:Uncharacterized protein n=1 Tax=Smallanthus sonchifolius TaxID=185202 RepID=A0ACB9HZ87_9ASTR|nr:hypothetical protein L1987_28651 [Smallanthus sonchifolius]